MADSPHIFLLVLLCSAGRVLLDSCTRRHATLQDNLTDVVEPLDMFIGSPRGLRNGADAVV